MKRAFIGRGELATSSRCLRVSPGRASPDWTDHRDRSAEYTGRTHGLCWQQALILWQGLTPVQARHARPGADVSAVELAAPGPCGDKADPPCSTRSMSSIAR
jgi:hypothetical protein